jgi:hypothetical protein
MIYRARDEWFRAFYISAATVSPETDGAWFPVLGIGKLT